MGKEGDNPATRRCIGALTARQDELRRALAGRSLRVELAYEGQPELRVVLTRSGLVVTVPPHEDFDIDVEIRGPREQVRAFLAGTSSLREAVLSGVVRLRMSEDAGTFVELRRIVAGVVAELD